MVVLTETKLGRGPPSICRDAAKATAVALILSHMNSYSGQHCKSGDYWPRLAGACLLYLLEERPVQDEADAAQRGRTTEHFQEQTGLSGAQYGAGPEQSVPHYAIEKGGGA